MGKLLRYVFAIIFLFIGAFLVLVQSNLAMERSLSGERLAWLFVLTMVCIVSSAVLSEVASESRYDAPKGNVPVGVAALSVCVLIIIWLGTQFAQSFGRLEALHYGAFILYAVAFGSLGGARLR